MHSVRTETLLLHAAALGDTREAARLIVEEVADVNCTNSNGSTPCHVHNTRTSCSSRRCSRFSALQIAAAMGYMSLLQFLIEQGADLDSQENGQIGGYTPLMYAIQDNNLLVSTSHCLTQEVRDRCCSTDGSGTPGGRRRSKHCREQGS